ncbi:Uncharacterized protein FKW44_002426 [Caligus rogercresseyi]|uniref:Protein quiver n=1 Tax=Caligus rogercresseyi TaxID=217165 RepID=A0A7T8KK69_CALRO|nr:Uncharacterized protein FKW44_002426 [Caligus rogercresseyi]
MKRKFLTSLFHFLLISRGITGDISCHYCGLRTLCPTIQCKTACFKFDGRNPSGDRVVVRECSDLDKNDCQDDAPWHGATGRACVCNGNMCNATEKLKIPSWLFLLSLLLCAPSYILSQSL